MRTDHVDTRVSKCYSLSLSASMSPNSIVDGRVCDVDSPRPMPRRLCCLPGGAKGPVTGRMMFWVGQDERHVGREGRISRTG